MQPLFSIGQTVKLPQDCGNRSKWDAAAITAIMFDDGEFWYDLRADESSPRMLETGIVKTMRYPEESRTRVNP